MKKKKINWGEYLFLAAILGYIVYYITDVYSDAFRAVFWPYCLMGAIVLLVLIVGIRMYIKAPAMVAAADAEVPEQPLSTRERLTKALPIVWIVIAFAAYALLLKSSDSLFARWH